MSAAPDLVIPPAVIEALISVVPTAVAVTLPDPSTVATVVLLVEKTGGPIPSIGRPA
jgi:hypothetical protein